MNTFLGLSRPWHLPWNYGHILAYIWAYVNVLQPMATSWETLFFAISNGMKVFVCFGSCQTSWPSAHLSCSAIAMYIGCVLSVGCQQPRQPLITQERKCICCILPLPCSSTYFQRLIQMLEYFERKSSESFGPFGPTLVVGLGALCNSSVFWSW